MARRRRQQAPSDGIRVRGFFRVHILEDGKIVGDSGWRPNQVVNLGFKQYLVDALGGTSKQIARMMLGTGTAPGATAETLDGELNTATYSRTTVTFAAVASKTARFTATFASANSHILAAVTLQNIGIINSTASAGTLFAGNTYATSQWNTNQDVQCTYEIQFS